MWQVEWESICLKNGRQTSACVNRLLTFALAFQYRAGSAPADFDRYLHEFLPSSLPLLGLCFIFVLIVVKWFLNCADLSEVKEDCFIHVPHSSWWVLDFASLPQYKTVLTKTVLTWNFFFFLLDLLLVNMICTLHVTQTILFLTWRRFSEACAQYGIALHIGEPLQKLKLD